MKVSGPVHGWFYFARRSGGELPTRELFTHMPSSIKGWKAYFFFVKNTGFPPLTWRENTQVTDPIPSPLPEAELDRLVSSEAQLKVKEFNNAQLWSAGLIRAKVNDPAPDLRPITPEELTALKRFSQLLNIGGIGSASTPTPAPSTAPSSTVPLPPPVSTPQIAAQSSLGEGSKKKRKKSTAKKARTEAASPQSQEEPSAAIASHYGVSSAEQQASSQSPPAMWRMRNVIPLKPPTELGSHPHPHHFCPKWGLSVNDRAQFPEVAKELVKGAVLPRDHHFIQLASNAELLEHFYLSTTQLNVAGAELAQRYENMGVNLSQVDAAKEKLSSQLEAAESELETLKKQLADANCSCELEKKRAAELAATLEVEQKKSAELVEAAREEGRQLGVKEFKKSEVFMNNLALLNGPVLQLGYTKALMDVESLKLPGFDLSKWPDFNPQSTNQIDRLVTGYSNGRDLAALIADPNLPALSPEPEQEQQGES
ncbi:uncharacterized protein [Coffea arabica]